MNNNIIYSKNMLWLKPFVDSASKHVDLSKIKAIKSYKVGKALNIRQYGSNIRSNGTYTINILTHKWNNKKKRYSIETIAMILDTLAHELSHATQKGDNFGKHDYKHFKKQALILLRFSYILKQMRILDTSKAFNNLL
jgi:hypothetical protein